VELHPALTIAGYTLRPEPSSPRDDFRGIWIEGFRGPQGDQRAWRTRPAPVLSLEAGNLAGRERPPLLLSLEKHASPIDSEPDPRPYVYEVGPHGFIARWRGSALAWPLLDARLLPGSDGVLCALHRRDSFLALSPQSKGTRVAAYRWNGFGFDGISDPSVVSRCRALWDLEAGETGESPARPERASPGLLMEYSRSYWTSMLCARFPACFSARNFTVTDLLVAADRSASLALLPLTLILVAAVTLKL